MLLRDASQGSEFSDTSVSKNDIDPSLRLDSLVETIKVGQFGNVSLNAGNIAADCLHGLIEFLLTAARDEDVSTFSDEELCCGSPYPGRAAGDDCHFSLQFTQWPRNLVQRRHSRKLIIGAIAPEMTSARILAKSKKK